LERYASGTNYQNPFGGSFHKPVIVADGRIDLRPAQKTDTFPIDRNVAFKRIGDVQSGSANGRIVRMQSFRIDLFGCKMPDRRPAQYGGEYNDSVAYAHM
jgi:hypothetical protein